jgi:hypothetical protein
MVNKDPDQDHSVKVVFTDTASSQDRSFAGRVDPVESPDTLYGLPKASMVVLRGNLRN